MNSDHLPCPNGFTPLEILEVGGMEDLSMPDRVICFQTTLGVCGASSSIAFVDARIRGFEKSQFVSGITAFDIRVKDLDEAPFTTGGEYSGRFVMEWISENV